MQTWCCLKTVYHNNNSNWNKCIQPKLTENKNTIQQIFLQHTMCRSNFHYYAFFKCTQLLKRSLWSANCFQKCVLVRTYIASWWLFKSRKFRSKLRFPCCYNICRLTWHNVYFALFSAAFIWTKQPERLFLFISSSFKTKRLCN